MIPPQTTKRIALSLTLLACAGMVWLTIRTCLSFLKGSQGDFVFFFEAATFYAERTNLYFQGQQGYLYPPLFAALLSPLSGFSQEVAATLYTVISSLAIAATAWLFSAGFVRNFSTAEDPFRWNDWRIAGIASAGFILIFGKVMSVSRLGQSDSFYLLAIALAFYAWPRFRFWSGFAIAFAINIKFTALLFVLYFLIRRDWRTLGGLGVGFLFFSFVPAIYSGFGNNLESLKIAYEGLTKLVGGDLGDYPDRYFHPLDWIRSVSFPSVAARYLGVSEFSKGVIALLLAFVGGLTGLAFLLYRKNGARLFRKWDAPCDLRLCSTEWAGIIILFIVFSPQSTTRHFYGALALSILVAYQAFNGALRSHPWNIVLSIVLILLAINFPVGGSGSPMAGFWKFHGLSSHAILIAFACQLWLILQQTHATSNEAESSSGDTSR